MLNIRMLLWGALAAFLYLNYDAWMRDYGTPAPAPATTVSAPGADASAPTRPAPTLGDTVPSAASPAAATTASAPALGAVGGTAVETAGADATQDLTVRTDVLAVHINLKGGELDQADLLQYPLRKDAPDVPVRLLNRDNANSLYVLQTGLGGDGTQVAPTHLVTWSAPRQDFALAPGADEVRVPLTWSDGAGLSVTKTFVFKRGSYAISLVYDARNAGAGPRNLALYAQILRHWEPAKRSYFDVETYSFKGPAIYDGTRSRDLKVEDAEDARFAATVTSGWLASMQHHFVAAIVPPAGQPVKYQLTVQNNQYLLNATGPTVAIPAGGASQWSENLFVGPKLQSQLAATGPKLERTADYGKLTVIAQPLFATLNWVHGLIGNWGWSIIIVTALIKLVFYPLSQASGRSMAKMRAVAPRMKQIQDTFKDDRAKLGQAMMELYKKEKINPLAGCLPMIVQIPFFISFYWVLLESVEMRQAPFMLWVNDLSAKDPFFVLPLLMGAAMFGQFKLNPAPPDPMQAKVMQFMPVIMTAMMAWFPSGLVLYWLTNTVLSIAQQLRINQVVEAEARKPRS
ncbi:MAG: membrane protein insertase YidC [Steroidobacterales bacterium]